MAGYVVLGLFAAFGLLSAVWTVFGWLLPGGKGMAMVCLGVPDEGVVSRYRWLRSLGFLRCPLLVTAEGDWRNIDGMEICEPEEIVSRLELERKQIDGAGNGDPPGHDRCCGVSEL